MIPVDISISDNVSAVLERAAREGGDLSAPFALTANAMLNSILDNFDREASPLGVPWKITERKRAQPGTKMLVKSTDLIGSNKSDFGADFAAAGPEASGGAADYAAVHQFGARILAKLGSALKTPFGPRGAVNVPARPFAGWNAALEDRTIKIFTDHLKALFAPIGGTAGAL